MSSPSSSSSVEALKDRGNDLFRKGRYEDAAAAYGEALSASESDHDATSTATLLMRATLSSNRAQCRLKSAETSNDVDAATKTTTTTELLSAARRDCDEAIERLNALPSSDRSSSSSSSSSLRSKTLFRRAKARWSSVRDDDDDAVGVDETREHLNAAAKDLLEVLSFDPDNAAAASLLRRVRERHASRKASSPMAGALESLRRGPDDDERRGRDWRVVYSVVCEDPPTASAEFGRRGGVALATSFLRTPSSSSSETTARILRALSAAASHAPFARIRATPSDLDPRLLTDLVAATTSPPEVADAAVALTLRLVVAFRTELDDDAADAATNDDDDDDDGSSRTLDRLVDDEVVHRVVAAAIGRSATTTRRAGLDLLSAWTSADWETAARAAGTTGLRSKRLSEADVRALPPRRFAAHKRREHAFARRRKNRAAEAARTFCRNGGPEELLRAAATWTDHRRRREAGLVLGRTLRALVRDQTSEKDDDPCREIKTVARRSLRDDDDDGDGPVVEEVFDEDEKWNDDDDGKEKDGRGKDLVRSQLVTSLLLADGATGAWALSEGWRDAAAAIERLAESDDPVAQSVASETLSSAASCDKTRSVAASLANTVGFRRLLASEDPDVASGAASAAAKLGLAATNEGKDEYENDDDRDEGEVVGLLQVAVDLLYGDDDDDDYHHEESSSFPASAGAETAVERGVEVLSYLASKTLVKEELAHGFQTSARRSKRRQRDDSKNETALERLVAVATADQDDDDAKRRPLSDLTAYGLASLFGDLVVSNETLRREAFADKDVTPEQYDELQHLGKTEEEKRALIAKQRARRDADPPAAVDARVRRAAAADVPRALVALMNACGRYAAEERTEERAGPARENTLERAVIAAERMAAETSVRGVMVQQGCLSACVKLEAGDDVSPKRRAILRRARHCVAKLLVTTDPRLLTSAQRLGAVAPLLELVHDDDSSDLATFEALLSLTNLASAGPDARERIVASKGVSRLHHATFSDHPMVRRAAVEAMGNLLPHPKVLDHLASPKTDAARLWLGLASDHEENVECARAAAGGLATACRDPRVARTACACPNAERAIKSMTECGDLPLMHRALVMVLGLLEGGDPRCRETVLRAGTLPFCRLYAENYHAGSASGATGELHLNETDERTLRVTVELAMEIVSKHG